MVRGRKVEISYKIPEEIKAKLKSDLSTLEKELLNTFNQKLKKIEEIYKTSLKNLSKKDLKRVKLSSLGFFDLNEAYDYLRKNGIDISFRAFGGRIERGVIPVIKVGHKRYIHKEILDHLISLERNFYTIREAYDKVKEAEPKLDYRAFIARVEKNSIPSVKFLTRRLIPRELVDTIVEVRKKSFSVAEAVKYLHKHGFKIRRNAFERRLDRKRIPYFEIGGRRYIPKEALDELLEKELGR